jgi:hypothetical protein
VGGGDFIEGLYWRCVRHGRMCEPIESVEWREWWSVGRAGSGHSAGQAARQGRSQVTCKTRNAWHGWVVGPNVANTGNFYLLGYNRYLGTRDRLEQVVSSWASDRKVADSNPDWTVTIF